MILHITKLVNTNVDDLSTLNTKSYNLMLMKGSVLISIFLCLIKPTSEILLSFSNTHFQILPIITTMRITYSSFFICSSIFKLFHTEVVSDGFLPPPSISILSGLSTSTFVKNLCSSIAVPEFFHLTKY